MLWYSNGTDKNDYWHAGQLTCVDESRGRLRRLRHIVDSYMPKSYIDEGKVRLVHSDGVAFVAEQEAQDSFDRVLCVFVKNCIFAHVR